MATLANKLPGLTLLTDPKLEASAAWGLAGPGAQNPAPATYLIGGDGVVRWRHLPDGRGHGDWPTYKAVADAL
jgi:hypothetical protein